MLQRNWESHGAALRRASSPVRRRLRS
ncbi:rCG51902 [Rattus norvegicus]|uniref:RCG51902 n=1 Tax=Rattus norvegicus TaxID=10116 RepID=A6K3H4_RAT|nr:rCG51902 [Rattus norvegicus]